MGQGGQGSRHNGGLSQKGSLPEGKLQPDAAGMFPLTSNTSYITTVWSPVSIMIPAELPPISKRIRSFSLSIGQLTFGSFLLLLAVITVTSIASVIAIRHIDSTFAELRRLQSVGDLAGDLDRRRKERKSGV